MGKGTIFIPILVISILVLVLLILKSKNKIKPQPAKSETPAAIDKMFALEDSATKFEPVKRAPAKAAKQPVTTSKKPSKQKPPIKKVRPKDAQFKPTPAKKPSISTDKPIIQPDFAKETKPVPKSTAEEPEKRQLLAYKDSTKNAIDAKTNIQQDSSIKTTPEEKPIPTDPDEAPAEQSAKNETDTSTAVAMVLPPSTDEKKPAKHFEPEDMPLPSQVEISKDVQTAFQDQKPEKELKNISLENTSDKFHKGMLAFRKKDYKYAIKFLANLPVPSERKRGIKEREEYVRGNFYRGLSFQKIGNLKEAVESYNKVLSVEKYFPVCEMNLGICYIELRQYAKAHRALQNVIRDQNRIPPDRYDQIIQRTRYFWALAWTRMFKYAKQSDKKEYFRQQATMKWKDYKAWFGGNSNFMEENKLAENYLNSLKARE
jgi:tetratricopeptide (TPR) repeat protein